MALLDAGQLFAGKYRIERPLGQGGFATVFLARLEEIGRPVAIKVLTPGADGTYDERLAQRFLREARLISELKSPHTVTLYDFGRHENLLYMVFEFVQGESLDAIIERGPTKARDVVSCMKQVLTSLGEAHQNGILHRDIKPANIMAESTPTGMAIKVLDFGIAKAIPGGERESNTITKHGSFIGTVRYVSPEQIVAAPLTPAADIYSTGLVAFELLTGVQANSGGSDTEVITIQVSPIQFGWPPGVEVDTAIQDIVSKMIRKNPTERFQTTTEVLEALRFWKASSTITAPMRVIEVPPTAETRSPRSLAIPAAVLLTALITVLSSLAIWSMSHEPPEARPPIEMVSVSFDDPEVVYRYVAKYGPPRQSRDAASASEVPPNRRAVVLVRSPTIGNEHQYVADILVARGTRRVAARYISGENYALMVADQRSGEELGVAVLRSTQQLSTEIHLLQQPEPPKPAELPTLIIVDDGPPRSSSPPKSRKRKRQSVRESEAQLAFDRGAYLTAVQHCMGISTPTCDHIRETAPKRMGF